MLNLLKEKGEMKKLLLMVVLIGLVLTSTGCSYKPNVGYDLGVITEGDVGSITLYLPVLTYKGEVVEKMPGMIKERIQSEIKREKKRIAGSPNLRFIDWLTKIKENIEVIDTKYGKMLKIYIPDRGYNKWGYGFEGGGTLPYAASSCKNRTARDDFRISPRLEEGIEIATTTSSLDISTYKKILTPIYAEFEKGTVTISLKLSMCAFLGEVGWKGVGWLDRLFGGPSPVDVADSVECHLGRILYYIDHIEGMRYIDRDKKDIREWWDPDVELAYSTLKNWVKESKERLTLTKSGWYIIPGIEGVTKAKYMEER
jgi:hypothetical protein